MLTLKALLRDLLDRFRHCGALGLVVSRVSSESCTSLSLTMGNGVVKILNPPPSYAGEVRCKWATCYY